MRLCQETNRPGKERVQNYVLHVPPSNFSLELDRHPWLVKSSEKPEDSHQREQTIAKPNKSKQICASLSVIRDLDFGEKNAEQAET